MRCIVFGHLTRMAVWKFRYHWNRALPVSEKLAAFAEAVSTCGDPEQLARWVMATEPDAAFPGLFYVSKKSEEGERGDVSF